MNCEHHQWAVIAAPPFPRFCAKCGTCQVQESTDGYEYEWVDIAPHEMDERIDAAVAQIK